MPLIIDGGRVPSRWADRVPRSDIAIDSHNRQKDDLQLALINNMPDAALEDTELQFFELLNIASGDLPVYIKLYSLNGIPRTDRGQQHLNSFYFPFDDLWQHRFDGVIITGTEPKCPNLRQEPYWDLLARVLDWAQRNTSSTILSCLAAHASVLHCDGIKRHALADKKFGLFDAIKHADHPLLSQSADRIRFPHSRWNEVRQEELISAGYVVLTSSAEAGVDLFVKQMERSLFVHFQGHPEYWAQTLAREYKRDIKRFLRYERETYPTMPYGYFCASAIQDLNRFQDRALLDRSEGIMELFPEIVVKGLQRGWESSSSNIYRNWLRWIALTKAQGSIVVSFARAAPEPPAAIFNNDIA
jgi:homoserine O-succinyltransferase/O-acetyltransferase